MNLLPTFSRACAHQNLSLRPRSINALQASRRQTQRQPRPQLQPRHHLTTSTHAQPRPIEVITQTTSTPPPPPSTTSPSPLPSPSSSTTTSNPNIKPTSSPSTTSPFLRLATVTRTNTMQKTIQLTTHLQTFDTHLQKHYTRPHRLLAHDPNPSGFLREGDVVEYGLFSPAEKQAMEAKRSGLERNLIEKGVIRLRTRKGRERKLRDVGVKGRKVRWVVRRVVTAWGVGVEER